MDTKKQAATIHQTLDQPIVIVGMMGTGKSHLGRKLAQMLALNFMDSDAVVEERADATIAEIFEQYGENKFREAERNAVLNLLEQGPCVIATGGGAVLNPDVLAAIGAKSVSIWLSSDIESIWKRVKNDRSRPLLQKDDPRAVLGALLEERKPLYSQADITVEAVDGSPEKTLQKTINSLYVHLNPDTF